MLFAPKGVMSTLKSPVKASFNCFLTCDSSVVAIIAFIPVYLLKAAETGPLTFGTAGHIEDAASEQLCEKAGAAISVSDINNVKNFIFFMI